MKKTYISVDRRGSDGSFQLSIGEEDENGAGAGYRITGPKYVGDSKTILKHYITKNDVHYIRAYLRGVK